MIKADVRLLKYFRVLFCVVTVLLTAASFLMMHETVKAENLQTATSEQVSSQTEGAGIPAAVKGGWNTSGGVKRFVLPDGSMAQGWASVGGDVYYFVNGQPAKRWKKIAGKYYYFQKSSGKRLTKWLKLSGSTYYLNPKANGARVTGMNKIGKYWYYFTSKGKMKTGWVKSNGKYYYFKSNGRRASGWLTVKGKKYYLNRTTGARETGIVTIDGTDYEFGSSGVLLRRLMTRNGNWYGTDGNKLYPSTIKNLLKTALQPVGTTVYVWGGGWNKEQTGSDITTRTIGVSPVWKQFYEKQTSAYDYTKTRFQIKNGLDCSGYVGWVIYNTFNRVSGRAGYVMLAENQARAFASYGWGSYTLAPSVKDFKAGDIMSTPSGHVYIVVGECSDGSIVLLHSSPSGVMISGTYTRAGNANSRAVSLAKKYMKKYYPDWYRKFPKLHRDSQYLTQYNQMRWYTGNGYIMTDPDGYREMTADQVLSALFK